MSQSTIGIFFHVLYIQALAKGGGVGNDFAVRGWGGFPSAKSLFWWTILIFFGMVLHYLFSTS
jgi:hypothetical protein